MPGGWVEIGSIDDIPRRGACKVRLGAQTIAVFRTGDDEVFALVDRCPHRGGPLSEGVVSGRTVACPLHNWIIDLQSGEACAPDAGCAPTLPVKLVGRRILLAVSGVSGAKSGAAA